MDFSFLLIRRGALTRFVLAAGVAVLIWVLFFVVTGRV